MEQETSQSNSSSSGLENGILEWIKKEKESLDSSPPNDHEAEDYSILMYETKDAYNHARSLRLKLQLCEKELQIKAKECAVATKERNKLIEKVATMEDEFMKKEKTFQERVERLEKQLIEKSHRNAELETKTDELKALCKIWQKKALATTPTGGDEVDEEKVTENKPTFRAVPDTVLALQRKKMLQKLYVANKKLNNIEKESDNTLNMNAAYSDVNQSNVPRDSKQGPKNDATQEKDQFEKTMTAIQEPHEMENHLKRGQLKQDEKDKPSHDERNGGIMSKSLGNQIEMVKTVTCKNDASVRKLILYCHTLIKQNTAILRKICTEGRQTGMKLERWIESYMILKRNYENGQDIYQQELKTSWNIEKEYKSQIKNLCEKITQLTQEVQVAKEEIQKYEASFDTVKLNVKTLDKQFDLITEISVKRLAQTQERLANLVKKCDVAQKNGKKKNISKHLPKPSFNSKRKVNESNESKKVHSVNF